MRIALTGNPNSGKTTMYNALTGRNEKVGNWAGVTVEKKEHPIKKTFCNDNSDIIVVDLPGAYSMSPFTSEESITSAYVKNEKPDVIINIVDATNLSRSLFFTTQLLELEIPMVVALNKADINEKKQTIIDIDALSKKLGCPVIETVSTSANGLKAVISAAFSCIGSKQTAPYSQGNIDFTDKKAVNAEDRKRFEFVNKIVKDVETRKVFTKDKNSQDKIDAILTNKWIGIPIFAVIMWAVFYVSQAWLGPMIADWLVGWIEAFGGVVEGWMAGSNEFLVSLVSSAIIDGVGAVVGFLPLVMVMYFMIALLEDCGYMSRATVVLDPIFKKVGLSGKSVIPFVIGTGCAIPGIMACRTIRNERERRATAMIAPFMPCGAKLPVIALFAGAFFPNTSWVGTAMYFVGIIIILLCALLINKITGYKYKKSFFIIELPEYKIPSLWRAVKSMCSRGWAYIVKAGTIILLCNVIVTLMSSFTPSLSFAAENGSDSILAAICRPIDWIIIPIIGFASWKLVACAITGFIAKENVVGTLATLFALSSSVINADFELVGESSTVVSALNLTPVAALAYLMFNLFTPPCFAAIGAMNAEMKSKKWLFGGITLQLAVGFIVGYIVFQVGTLITTGSFGAGFIPGLIALLVIVAIIVYLCINTEKKLKAEYALNSKKSATHLSGKM